MFTKAFWTATLQRVIRSFAASLVSLLIAGGTDLLHTNWSDRLAVSGMAAVVTLLLCVAGGATGTDGPAFGNVETTDPPAGT